MKNKRKLNKLIFMMLVLSLLAVSLIGCGNTASPAVGEDVVVNGTEESTVENTESTMPPNGDDATATVDSDTESTNESSDIEDDVVAGASGEEESGVMAGPEPTAEPTPEPHTHDYAETVVTKQPSCTETGEKQLICQGCDDVKTESVPAMGHDFVPQYTTVVHEALGHVEITEQQVQVGTTETRHEYECKYCGFRADTASGVVDHQAVQFEDGIDHAFAGTIIYDYPGSPIYETETVSNWVIDVPSWSEQVPSGSICSRCGVAGP